jgi:16S rRNA processing protein RimM
VSHHLLQHVLIGQIANTHGVNGELVLHHQIQNKKELDSWNCLILEIEEKSFIPYFIEKIKHSAEGEAIIKFEDISTPEEAKKITNTKAYCNPLIEVKSLAQNEWEQLIGFILIDEQTNSSIGEIHQIVEGVGQQFFEVLRDDKEVLIPFHQDFIQEVNPEKKTIHLNLPDGFIETFL